MRIVLVGLELSGASLANEAMRERVDRRHDEKLSARVDAAERARNLLVGRAHGVSWMGP